MPQFKEGDRVARRVEEEEFNKSGTKSNAKDLPDTISQKSARTRSEAFQSGFAHSVLNDDRVGPRDVDAALNYRRGH